MSDELITLGQAAEILKIHRATVARLVSEGKIPAATIAARGDKPSGTWRYVKRADVEKFALTYDPRPGRRKKTRRAARPAPGGTA